MENGLLPGEICNRNGCKGIISQPESEGGCSCHINPPCSNCCRTDQYCEECGWGNEEPVSNTTAYQQNTVPRETIYDPSPIYEVRRYFDDIYEATIKNNLPEKEAYELAKNYAKARPRHYVSFGVYKMDKPK